MKNCEVPNCNRVAATYKSKTNGLMSKRWCYHHLDGAGEKERREYSKTVILKNSNYRHGMAKTRPHSIWLAMKARCDRKTAINYRNYGALGIKYDKRWKDFLNFWEDMKNGYADNLTLDRIDGKKGYYKENCRWITQQEQCLNTRRNRFLTYAGKTQTVVQWERELGFNRGIVNQRINAYGWSVDKALTKPMRKRRKNFNSIVGVNE